MPENWETVKLNEVIVSANTGLDAIKRAPIVDVDTGIKCLRIQDVSQGKEYEKWGNTRVTPENFKKFALKKGEIIIARTGNTIGVNKFISEDLNSVFNNGLIRLRIDKKICDPKYIYYNFRSNIFKAYIQAIAFGTSTQPNMQINSLLSFEFELPPLQEQKSIASILSALDDKIELNLQMNKTLEEMAMAFYKHWFVDFGPFQDGEFVDSELGEIPKDWEVRKFGELISNKRKNVPATEIREDDKYVGLEHIEKGSLSLFNYGFGVKVSSNKTAFSKGDILFGKLRPYFKKIAIAPFDGICSTDILVIEPNQFYDYGFALFTIFNDKFIDYTTTVSGGTRMPRVNWNSIQNYKVIVPKSPELIQKFDVIVRDCISQILYNVSENQTLSQLRDTLLPKLISGEVRVKDVEKTLSEVL